MKRGVVFGILFILGFILILNFVSAGLFTGKVVLNSDGWTPWLDRDNPSAKGDYETLTDFVSSGKSCEEPSRIEWRAVNGEKILQTTHYNEKIGFYCLNSENSQGCLDYEVRFYCGEESEPICNDPDGGKNYGVASTVTITQNGEDINGKPDYCFSSSGSLAGYVDEAYCENGEIRSGSYKCPYGCKNGACLPKPVCGNGICETGEECDTGNPSDSDGCSYFCEVLDGWECTCTSGGSVCEEVEEDCAGTCLNLGLECGYDECGNYCGSCNQGHVCNLGGCIVEPICRNGIQEVGEQCDGNSWAVSASCQYFGYDSGTLSCNNLCKFDFSNCKNNPSYSCTDSDAQNEFVKGVILGIDESGNSYSNWDKCSSNDEIVVVEYYCENNLKKYKNINCPQDMECYDGACIEKVLPTQECNDSDGGKNYYVKGHLTDSAHNAAYDDFCFNDDLLREHYCGDINYQYEYYPCPNGCEDGACISENPVEVCDLVVDGQFQDSDNDGCHAGFDSDCGGIEGVDNPSLTCNDGIDNDCDGMIDEEDDDLSCNLECGDGICGWYEKISSSQYYCVEDCIVCFDSDNGKNYGIKGTLLYGDIDSGGLEYPDFCRIGNYGSPYGGDSQNGDDLVPSCSGGTCWLVEHFCNEGNPPGNWEMVNCPNGCEDGACIGNSETLCEEKSVCMPGGYWRGTLNSDCSWLETEWCENGCENGTCVEIDMPEIYPSPFIFKDFIDIAIVYGTKADSALEFVGAENIQSDLHSRKANFTSDLLVKDSELNSVKSKNWIVVGTPCANSAFSEFLEGDCNSFGNQLDFKSGQFVIESFKHPSQEGKIALLVVGYDVDDVLKAAEYLATHEVRTSIGFKYIGTRSLTICLSDLDCLSSEKCVEGECITDYSSDEQSEESCKYGCFVNGQCYPLGYRKSGEYCSESSVFIEQFDSNSVCDNNFECSSNLCIDGECISGSLIRKILDFFRNLFS